MMKRTFVAGILACVLCLGAAPSPASRPSTKPAATTKAVETLDQKEAKLAALRAQVAALETEINQEKSATQPAVMELVQLLQSMPKDLWPTAQENAIHKSARDAWIKSSGIVGRTVKWSGSVQQITPSTKQITVVLFDAKVDAFSLKPSMNFRAVFPVSESQSLINLKSKDPLAVVGKISGVEITPSSIRVEIQESAVEKG